MLAATPTWFGSVPTWLLFLLAVFVAYRLSAGGAGSAVSELSKANEVLERRLHEERERLEQLGGEVRDLREANAELKGRTDFASALAGALTPLLDWTAGHEQRAQERHEAVMKSATSQLNVLELVARRLGPDENGGHDDG